MTNLFQRRPMCCSRYMQLIYERKVGGVLMTRQYRCSKCQKKTLVERTKQGRTNS